jgi:hypothetical protein
MSGRHRRSFQRTRPRRRMRCYPLRCVKSHYPCCCHSGPASLASRRHFHPSGPECALRKAPEAFSPIYILQFAASQSLGDAMLGPPEKFRTQIRLLLFRSQEALGSCRLRQSLPKPIQIRSSAT